MYIAAGAEHKPWPSFLMFVGVTVGFYMAAGAANAINMVLERDLDLRMGRTATRPTVTQKIPPRAALRFAFSLMVGSFALLWATANMLSAMLALAGLAFYVVIYTMLLKRRTWTNIVIGGAAGAFPPMIGWAVATGGVSLESVAMFALIFLWTPPHFWALALFRNDDYARVGVPMLPVTAGPRATRNHILGYAVVLAIAAVAPAFSGIGGPVYLAGALVLNALFLRGAWAIWRRDEAAATADRFRVEKRFFGFSIVYLFLHFALLLAEAACRAAGLTPAGWPVLA
jgi:protoheme IX farnesyltransferase